MLIVNKDRNGIINIANITNIYIEADGCTIKADYVNGKGCQIGRYVSEKEAKTAISIAAKNMQKSGVCMMPDDNEIRAQLALEETKWHHVTGKKVKGHGGS